MKKLKFSLATAIIATMASLSTPAFADDCVRPPNRGGYDRVDCLSEGLAVVNIGGIGDKYGYIDRTGRLVIPVKYDLAQSFSEGLASVMLNGKKVFIDRTGKVVFSVSNYDAVGDFKEGLVSVRLNSVYGYLDRTGRVVIPLRYFYAQDFSEGLAVFTPHLNGKWGYIDRTGRTVIPAKYDDAFDFSEGLARVKLNDKYGYIDRTGRVVIPIEYDRAQDFEDGYATVCTWNEAMKMWEWDTIDKSGKYMTKGSFFEDRC